MGKSDVDDGVAMKIADALERRVLGTARFVCLIMFAGALLSMIAVALVLLSGAPAHRNNSDPPVSASEVLSEIPGMESANDALSGGSRPALQVPNAFGLTVPPSLHTVLVEDDDSQMVLNDWLRNVPAADRQPFLNELADVVTLASQHAASWEWDDRQRYIAAAMSQYAHRKTALLADAQSRIAAQADRKDQCRLALGLLIAVTGLLTLLLVLLSIEKNTRSLRARNGV